MYESGNPSNWSATAFIRSLTAESSSFLISISEITVFSAANTGTERENTRHKIMDIEKICFFIIIIPFDID